MSMRDKPIEEGELLAYLDGAQLPHVEQALRASSELRRELETLRKTSITLRRAFGGISRPDPQDLVDVATGKATPNQELRVAAYLRASPTGREEMQLLKAELQSFAQPTRRFTRRLPTFFAVPVLGGVGTRSATASTPTTPTQDDNAKSLKPPSVRALPSESLEQSFYVAALEARIALQILPPEGERWQIQGRVTQQQQPVTAARVTLRAPEHRPRPRTTDPSGFFSFARVSSGTYRLQVYFEEGVLVIPEIILRDD